MPVFHPSKTSTAAAFAVIFFGILLGCFLAQNVQVSPEPSPTVSPSPSPTASPSPQPTATPTPLPGAQNFHQWGSITVFNGLPSDSVRAIAQSNDGVMWFGTDNGLARFDGRRIQNFSLGDTESARITALEISPAGELLVGTGRGLFVRSEDSFYPVDEIQDEEVTALLVSDEIYCGTGRGSVFKIRRANDGKLHTSTTEDVVYEPVRTVIGPSPSAISSLVATDGGILISHAQGGTFTMQKEGVSLFEITPRPTSVNKLLRDRTGSLWLGNDAPRGVSGLFIFHGGRATRIAAPTSKVLSLEANDNGVWAGSERFGLFHFAGTKLKKNYTFENTSGGLRSNTVYTLFTDREGVLWIGTNRGVSRFDQTGALQETVSDIPNSNFIRCLFHASDGTLYAGSNRGLFVKRGDKWNQLPAYGNQPIFAVSENSAKKLIVETEYVPKRSFSSGGATWSVREGGLFRESDGSAERIFDAEDVRDVFAANDHVWAATTTRGLIHARKDNRFGWLVSPIGFEQGLPSEKAFAILPTGEGLLIGTNRGVVEYSVGSVAPKIIPTRALSQRAHDLSEIASKIDLEYPQNSLLVEVAGQSSRTFPEEFQYAFVLTNSKGEEVARQLSNDPQYAPTDLPADDYRIEAIAFNRDLLPSDPLFINFSVAKAPFPWTATALGILLAIAIVGLVWAIVEHRRIAQRNRELAAARFDLANEAERERRRIARDLHDQTLADLRNLMLLSDKISPDKPEFRAEIESVSSEIRRICEDLSPSVLENVGLIAALEFLLKRTIEKSEFRAEENLEDRIALPMNAQLQVYRIAQEVLTNIKKHSNADRVEMSVSISENKKLVLAIADNGEPFEHNGKNSAGRGIANIRARASLIQARVDWSARNGKGNRFSLEVDA